MEMGDAAPNGPRTQGTESTWDRTAAAVTNPPPQTSVIGRQSKVVAGGQVQGVNIKRRLAGPTPACQVAAPQPQRPERCPWHGEATVADKQTLEEPLRPGHRAALGEEADKIVQGDGAVRPRLHCVAIRALRRLGFLEHLVAAPEQLPRVGPVVVHQLVPRITADRLSQEWYGSLCPVHLSQCPTHEKGRRRPKTKGAGPAEGVQRGRQVIGEEHDSEFDPDARIPG